MGTGRAKSSWRTCLIVLLLLSGAALLPFIAGSRAGDPPRARGARHARAAATPVPLPANLAIPQYRPGPQPFKDGETLIYEASWEGIPAGQARITLHQKKSDPLGWVGEMWLNSSPVVDKLYRMRDYFREDFAPTSWQPSVINILQHEKQRRDHWLATFDRPRQLVTAVKTNKAGRTWTRRFSGGDPWGPFSGAMMALSQPLTPGKGYIFDVFSGGNRYVLKFTVQAREQITTTHGVVNALRIEPTVVWLSDNSFRDQATETTIWVTDDSQHLPLRIRSAVFIGAVVVELVQVSDGSSGMNLSPDPPP